jgi:hypothetical protein
MTYALAILWFVVGYVTAIRQCVKRIEREKSVRDSYKWQLGKRATTPEAYRETAQSYFKLPYDQRGDANGN